MTNDHDHDHDSSFSILLELKDNISKGYFGFFALTCHRFLNSDMRFLFVFRTYCKRIWINSGDTSVYGLKVAVYGSTSGVSLKSDSTVEAFTCAIKVDVFHLVKMFMLIKNLKKTSSLEENGNVTLSREFNERLTHDTCTQDSIQFTKSRALANKERIIYWCRISVTVFRTLLQRAVVERNGGLLYGTPFWTLILSVLFIRLSVSFIRLSYNFKTFCCYYNTFQ